MAKVSKEKQAKTLKDMKKRRKEDSIHLRSIIENKIKWANEERQKGLQSIETLKQQVLKLEGSIIVLNQVLKESTGVENDNN
jgi:hypothetical protein